MVLSMPVGWNQWGSNRPIAGSQEQRFRESQVERFVYLVSRPISLTSCLVDVKVWYMLYMPN
jgi:hypothetical protein